MLAHCLVIEADMPLLADEVRTARGERVRYRAVNTSVRLQLRPFSRGPHALAGTLGFLSRVGNATVDEGDIRKQVTNLGARITTEYAYRVSDVVELVWELGVDVAFTDSRASVRLSGQRTYLEDRWSPWVVAGVRFRPDFRQLGSNR